MTWFSSSTSSTSSTARMYCEVPNDQCPDHSYLRDILNGVELKAEIVHIPVDDTFSAERKTCMLLGIKEIGSNSALCRKGSRGHLRTSLEIQLRAHPVHHRQVKTSSLPAWHLLGSMEIPYIETRWNYRSQNVIGQSVHQSLDLSKMSPRIVSITANPEHLLTLWN